MGGGDRVTQAYPLDTPLMELINFRLQRGGWGGGGDKGALVEREGC